MTSMNSLLRKLHFVVLFLLSNLGYGFGGTFDSARLVPAGSDPTAVAVGDFNHDGKLDMVVADAGVGASSVSVLLGNGKGTFQPPTTIALDATPVAVVVGDFNGDGILDIAALTTDVFVLLGNGDGTFRIGGMFAVGPQPTSLATADFNHDGKLDLAVIESRGVDVLLGNGNGTFKTAATYPAGDGPVWVATGDFNGDGKVDLAVSAFDQNTGAISMNVLLGKGNGTFASPIVTGKLKAGGGNVVVGDFNDDGRLDVAIGGLNLSGNSSPIAVLFGDGTGKFNSPEYVTTGQDPASVATGDFNGDGKPDLIAANGRSGDVTVLLGNGKGKFQTGPNYAAGYAGYRVSALAMAVGDFNGDGKPDLVVSGGDPQYVNVLLNLGEGRFAAAQDFRTEPYGYYVAVGHFTRDGKQDLAIGSDFGQVSVLLGKGNGTFGASKSVETRLPSNGFLATGDLNGDGISDLATFSFSASTVTVLLGKGDGTFQAPNTFFAGPNINWLAVGDFNNDGKLDLVVCAGKFLVVLLGNGDGTFQSPKDTTLPNPTATLAVGDFDGDGNLDVAVSYQTNGVLSILLGKGDGSFGKPRNFNVGVGSSRMAVGDFNGDGKLDMAFNDQTNRVNVILGNGDGTFGKPLRRSVNATLDGWIVSGDFNLDGKLDVAVGASGAAAYLLLGNGDGTLKPAKQIGSARAGGAPLGPMVTSDFNGDSKPDIVVVTDGGPTILLNTSK